MYWNLEKIMQM